MKENKKNPETNTMVKPIPEGYHSITPFIVSVNASMLIEFIKTAFDGNIIYNMKSDDGKVMHAVVRIGDSNIMISDSNERIPPTACMLYLYVGDVDKTYRQAIDAKGISLREPTNEFYGDRSACVKDAWDNQWWIATHVEDVSNEEMKKREEEFRKKETLQKSF
jgi:PhnB protein